MPPKTLTSNSSMMNRLNIHLKTNSSIVISRKLIREGWSLYILLTSAANYFKKKGRFLYLETFALQLKLFDSFDRKSSAKKKKLIADIADYSLPLLKKENLYFDINHSLMTFLLFILKIKLRPSPALCFYIDQISFILWKV